MEEAKLIKSAMDKENKEWLPVWGQIECLRTGLLDCRCWFGIGIDFPWSSFSHGQFALVSFWGYLYNVSEWFPWATPERSSRTEKTAPFSDGHSKFSHMSSESPLAPCFPVHCADHAPSLTCVHIPPSSLTRAQGCSSGETLSHRV